MRSLILTACSIALPSVVLRHLDARGRAFLPSEVYRVCRVYRVYRVRTVFQVLGCSDSLDSIDSADSADSIDFFIRSPALYNHRLLQGVLMLERTIINDFDQGEL